MTPKGKKKKRWTVGGEQSRSENKDQDTEGKKEAIEVIRENKVVPAGAETGRSSSQKSEIREEARREEEVEGGGGRRWGREVSSHLFPRSP